MNLISFEVFGYTISASFYGLMYALSFIIGYLFIKTRTTLLPKNLDDLFLYAVLGVVLGGRIGYTLFYNFSYYISKPLEIFAFWEGGMSFHGGLVGVILASLIFAKRYQESFLKVTDMFAIAAPIGLFFGRIGNYVNKELLGYEYSGPLAVTVGERSYFPSPLLEAFLEGVILFVIIKLLYFKLYRKKDITFGYLSSAFLIGYAVFRIFVEYFFRQPDSHIGYLFGKISMGSLLSFFMIFVAIVLLIYIKNKKR